jgi:DNA-binding NarL/FixJ family response regulator
MSALPLGPSSSRSIPGKSEQLTSVLICDDRAEVRRGFAEKVGQPEFLSGSGEIVGVADGFGLLQALEAQPDAAVLIAIHSGSSTGSEAVTMLLGRYPSAAPIIVGSAADIDLLAEAYARGAGGLLLWEP